MFNVYIYVLMSQKAIINFKYEVILQKKKKKVFGSLLFFCFFIISRSCLSLHPGSVRLCWMESSFVGIRPTDSPETPMSLATDTDVCTGCNATNTESCSCCHESDVHSGGLYLDLQPSNNDQQLIINRGGSRSACQSPKQNFNVKQQQQQQQQRQQHRGELLMLT